MAWSFQKFDQVIDSLWVESDDETKLSLVPPLVKWSCQSN